MISEQLVKNPYGGIILYGKDGTGVVDDALELGAAIANYGSQKNLSMKSILTVILLIFCLASVR